MWSAARTALGHARFVGVAGLLVIGSAAHAAPFTTQAAHSQIDADGATQAEENVSAVDDYASSQAIWPAGTGIPQARTAARSSAVEIAVNARVFSDTFEGRDFDLALSQAFYSIELDPVLMPTRANLEFFLPPSYVEIVQNAEVTFGVLETILFADLRVCQRSACGLADQVFYFQVDLSGTYRDLDLAITTDGDPSLDLTPLRAPAVTETGGFVWTYLAEFPEFVGELELGTYAAGLPVRVEYVLQARASGLALSSSAIAAVNDPFLFDTDPVQRGAPFSVTLVPVPEPATALLCAVGMALLGGGMRWNGRCLTPAAEPPPASLRRRPAA